MATDSNPEKPDPIESLAARVKNLEQHEHGWSISRVGILIGCVGGLIGGFSTLREMWRQSTAQPHFEVVAERFLTLSWDPQGRSLSITRNIALQNTGDKIGAIPNPPVARLESASLSNPETLSDISATDNTRTVDFPLPIKAADARNLTLVMTSKLAKDAEPGFPKEGTYKLVFSLETPSSTQANTYCFQLTSDLIDQLNSTGTVRMVHPATPCTEGGSQ